MTDPPAPVEPAPSPEPRRKREAGRNLPLAIGTGVLLGGALLTTLVLSRRAFIAYAVLTVIYDTFAYATGVLIGRHPLAPAVSPHKSWEGAAGATAACLLAGAFLLPRWEPWTFASGLTLAAVTCVVAPLGDLSE